MIESFSFIVNGTEKTFSSLHSDYGFILQDIQDLSSVNWDIATNKNPYWDGAQINNRTANPRTIIIRFGYTGKVNPEIADKNLFEYLAPVLSDDDLTIKKTKNSISKYINGKIESINRNVFSEKPTLEISILADPFWHGDVLNYDLRSSDITDYDSVNHALQFKSGIKFIGELRAGFQIKLICTSNNSALTNEEMNFSFFGKSFGIKTTIETVPSTIEQIAFNKLELVLDTNQTFSYQKKYYNNSNVVYQKYVISDITENSQIPQLVPNIPIESLITLDSDVADSIMGLASVLTVTEFSLSYQPLYIR